MDAFLQQTAISLRLHYRNRMALLYSYLFPLIFLLAFYVLYRHERVVLARHMGELLTVGILGGACFGLPTTMVSERERGVWRRYRLAPVSTAGLVTSTVAARYTILVSAGLLQLAASLALGMPLPRHPVDLVAAFTLVSFAFIGLGLVMATMADNVPAVQALGQCIFLPMLIIGGIAVPLASLPDWAQHVSAFFPGRYAVQALQACVNGAGIGAVGFDVLALTIIGAAGCVAGAVMFRWDAQQRFAARGHKGWLLVPLAAWAMVGALSEATNRVATTPSDQTVARARHADTSLPAPSGSPAPVVAPPGTAGHTKTVEQARTPPDRPPSAATPPPGTAKPPSPAAAAAPQPGATGRTGNRPAAPQADVTGGPGNRPAAPPAPAPAPGPATPPPVKQPIAASWREVTRSDIDRDLTFDHLPSDEGIVAPIAPAAEEPSPEVNQQLEAIAEGLPKWGPARVPDPVQRARNILYVAAVPDVLQTELERFAPAVVFDELERSIPKDDLIKVLYWIALHPMDGDHSAIEQLPALGFESRAVDVEEARERVALYAVKLLGRLVGAIRGR